MSDYNTEKMRILDMIDRGDISAADGERLIRALGPAPATNDDSGSAGGNDPGGPQIRYADDADPGDTFVMDDSTRRMVDRFKRWWQLPMWLGLGIAMLAAFGLSNAVTGGTVLGTLWTVLWLLAGVAVMALAWSTRSARWVHLRVQRPNASDGPRNIKISLPLPLKLVAWLLRSFGHYIPQLQQTAVDELLLSLEETGFDEPMFINVSDTPDGERVQIYIG